MTTSAKPRSSAPARRPGKPSLEAPKPTVKPFLRFHHSEALRKKTLSVLGSLEQAKDPTAHRDALASLIIELTNTGLEYFLLKPLKLAKVGFLVEQSAGLGLVGAQQVLGSIIRNIIGRMDAPQLLSVCGSIRQLMH